MLHYLFGTLVILVGLAVIRYADSLRRLWLASAQEEKIPFLSKGREKWFGNPDTNFTIKLLGGFVAAVGVVLLIFGRG